MFTLTDDLRAMYKCIVPSYRNIIEQNIRCFQQQAAQQQATAAPSSNRQQTLLSVGEKLLYYKLKFEAFTIEITNVMAHDKYESLDTFVDVIIVKMVEFYVCWSKYSEDSQDCQIELHSSMKI